MSKVPFALAATLVLAACSGGGDISVPVKKSPSMGDIATACEGAVAKTAEDARETIEMMIAAGEREGLDERKVRARRRAKDDLAKTLEKRGVSDCCKVMREDARDWQRRQRTYAYSMFVLSYFDNFTPNERDALIEYRDAARSDLTTTEAAGPAAINRKFAVCMRTVRRETDRQIREKHDSAF